MKRILTIILVLAAATAFAQDMEPPMYGLYESTDRQFLSLEDSLEHVRNGITFRIGISPEDPGYVWVLWDYDGDGLRDEEVERYRYEIDGEGIYWTDSDGVYASWFSDGEWFMLLDFEDEQYIVVLRQLKDWAQTEHQMRGRI